MCTGPPADGCAALESSRYRANYTITIRWSSRARWSGCKLGSEKVALTWSNPGELANLNIRSSEQSFTLANALTSA